MDFLYNLFGINNNIINENETNQTENYIKNEINNNENNLENNLENYLENNKFIPSIEELKIGKNNLKKTKNNKKSVYSLEDELKLIKNKLKKPLSYNTYVIKF